MGSLVVFGDGGLGPAFLGEEEEELEVVFVLGVDREEIEFADELLVDGFAEDDFVDAPLGGVGEDDPVDALIGGVVDGLLDVGILEFAADGLGLEEDDDLAIELDREVAVGAADGELGGDLEVLLIAEDFAEEVVEEDDGVGFVDVLAPGEGEDGLKFLNAGGEAVGYALGEGGHAGGREETCCRPERVKRARRTEAGTGGKVAGSWRAAPKATRGVVLK